MITIMKKCILIFIILFLFSCVKKNDNNEAGNANNVDENIVVDIYKNNRIKEFELREYIEMTYNSKEIENITSLSYIRMELKEIPILDFLYNLVYLNLSGNNLKIINGLSKLIKLKELHIIQNTIEKIEGLDNLTNLEVFLLRFNWIKKIEGLDNLTNLKKLNLSNNEIEVIEGLENLTKLESFEIVDNYIKDYSGLLVLKGLKMINVIGDEHIKDEKARKILRQVRDNNPDANLYGFDWIDE